MTAINSHVVREIARDCASARCGHVRRLHGQQRGRRTLRPGNGVPAMVATGWPWCDLPIWVKSTRVGQLLSDVIDRYRRGETAPDTWHGMEMFLGNEVTADDPRLTRVYDNFRSNLTDICARARRAGIAVILSTVAVNSQRLPTARFAAPVGPFPGGLGSLGIALSGRRRGGSERRSATGDRPLERGGPDRRSLCRTPVPSRAVPGGDGPDVGSSPAIGTGQRFGRAAVPRR